QEEVIVHRILAKDLMSGPVKRLTVSTPVRDAAAFLHRHGISGAPVVDRRGRWVGVFTQSDLARHVQSGLLEPKEDRTLESREPVGEPDGAPPKEFARTPVRDLMTRGLFTVSPDDTVEQVMRTLLSLHVHRVFVLDPATGNLDGVITTLDVLRVL